MKVAIFSSKPYDRQFLEAANAAYGHELHFFEPRLTEDTASLADGYPVVCAFVNDQLSAPILERLSRSGTRLVALRSAGFNHVDLVAAEALGIKVARVPAYSPYAVAEHTVGMILALTRKIHRAYNRVREGNFALDGLLGFDLHGRTIGIIGTGQIGAVVAQIMRGFGCHVLAYDPYPNPKLEDSGLLHYVPLKELLKGSDIVSLHCPLTPDTYHLINSQTLRQMKHGAMLINTSRGALLDTASIILALKSGRIRYLGLDVYEEEEDLFFEDLSDRVLQDDVFARLLTFPNVIITGHQAFFTQNALQAIAEITLENIRSFENGEPLKNEVTTERVRS
jgi:D-lactate dehydrogenase